MSNKKKTEEQELPIVVHSTIGCPAWLTDLALLFGFLKHKYFVDAHVKKIDYNIVKSSYIEKYKVPGRLFNAVATEVDRIVEAYYSNIKNKIFSLKEKIDFLIKKIKTNNAYLKKLKKDKNLETKKLDAQKWKTKKTIHFAKRKIHRLQDKLDKAQKNLMILFLELLLVQKNYKENNIILRKMDLKAIKNGLPFGKPLATINIWSLVLKMKQMEISSVRSIMI